MNKINTAQAEVISSIDHEIASLTEAIKSTNYEIAAQTEAIKSLSHEIASLNTLLSTTISQLTKCSP